MPYEFQKVDILVFDYHPAIGALESADQIQNDVRFVVEPIDYIARHKSGEELQKKHFKIGPMKWRMLSHNHFWKHYQTAGESSVTPDFWSLQIPFVCRPLESKIEVDTTNPNFEGRARAFTFLSGIGWSTNLEIRLFGTIKPKQLRDFVGKLLVGAPIFALSGEAKTLKDIFVDFSDRVMADIYVPELVAPPRIKRHLIISLSEFTGDISYYRSKGLGADQMPASDRAMMHSILQGKEISMQDVIKLEREKEEKRRFVQVEFLGADFALTYFEHGTLIFLQRAALRNSALWEKKRKRKAKKRKRNTMKCHAANVRSYSLMTLAMRRFYADTAKHAGRQNKVDLLRQSIEKNLIDLPSKYDNPLSTAFREKYNSTKR